MTVKQSKRKQIFWWLVVACVLATMMCLYLTSCRLYQTPNDEKQDHSSTQQDAYEAKIVYYQAQIQNLNNQLTNMEQQMYLMREDYMTQLEALEQKFNASSNQSEQNQIPEDTNDPEDSSTQQGTTQPQPPPSDTPNETEKETGSSGVTSDQEQEIQLCEYTYRLENGCAILTLYLGDDQDVVVPAAVDGHLVVGIADRAFADCKIRSVTLPDTIKTLGWFTFYRCDQLEKVVLPASLSSIGYASFDGCASTLCLHVPSGSYAEEFAISFGLPYRQIL